MKKPRVVRGFKKRFWVNLNWITDTMEPGPVEAHLYKTKEECLATLPSGDKMIQVEIREVKKR